MTTADDPGGVSAPPVQDPPSVVPAPRPAFLATAPASGLPASGLPATGVPAPGYPVSGYPVSGYPVYVGYPVSGPYPGYGWVAQPPRRDHAWLRWLAGSLAVLLVCAVLSVGALVAFADHLGTWDTAATWRAGSADGVGFSAPPSSASGPEWNSWARRSVPVAVTSQGKALLSGDEQGFLANVDPGNAALVASLRHRYAALHAMGLGVWTQSVVGGVIEETTHTWSAIVKMSYCFGGPDCAAVSLTAESKWSARDGRLVMIELHASGSEWNGPRPWETDELVVRTGKRVVVAATKSTAWRLTEAVTYADRAALVADKFAKWEAPPSRYVIFFAGPKEWNKWYGHDQPNWAAAWTVPVSNRASEVVVRSQAVFQADLQTLLSHELTHVTSLAGKRDGADRSAWWLIEGIAEYASMLGRPVSDYDGLSPTHSYVRGAWNGNPVVDAPSAAMSQTDVAGRYGVAYLAVKRIADKYGQNRMLDLFGRVVHDAEPLESAAKAALGTSWTTARADCARYIRGVV